MEYFSISSLEIIFLTPHRKQCIKDPVCIQSVLESELKVDTSQIAFILAISVPHSVQPFLTQRTTCDRVALDTRKLSIHSSMEMKFKKTAN